MGNPNVGKSVIFSRLTGVNVIASNYAGTTVGFTKGYIKIGDETAEVIDVPGALTTRVLETKRERFIGATLMAIAVPCMAQRAMIVGLIK